MTGERQRARDERSESRRGAREAVSPLEEDSGGGGRAGATQEALERAMASLAFGPAIDAQDPGAVRAWLEESGVGADDIDAILDSNVERLLFYRELVRGRLHEALQLSIPRTMARLGDVFEEYFARFLAERAPQTHYLRDVTDELLDFCEPLWQGDARVPPYMIELARHEALQIEIGAMATEPVASSAEGLELDRSVRFIEAARLVRYQHTVHALPEDEDDRSEPRRTPTALFVYRNPEHEVRYLELSPLAAALLDGLFVQGKSLQQALLSACEAESRSIDQSVLDGTAQLLADLAGRGALVGAGEQVGG